MENLTIEQKLMISLAAFLPLAVVVQVVNRKQKEIFGIFYCGICAGYCLNVVFVEEFLVLDAAECFFRGCYGILYMVKAFRSVCGSSPYLYSKFQHQMILRRNLEFYCWKVELACCGDVNKVVWIVGTCFGGNLAVLVMRIAIGVYYYSVSDLAEIDSVIFVTVRLVDIFITLINLIILTPISPKHPPIKSIIYPSLASIFSTILLYSFINESFQNRIFLSSSFNFLYTLILSNY